MDRRGALCYSIYGVLIMKKRGRPKGMKLSDETKEKIAAARRGRKHSEQTKEKIAERLKEYFKTPAGEKAKEKARELGKKRMKGKKFGENKEE